MLLVFEPELFSVFLLLHTSQTKLYNIRFIFRTLKHNKPHQSFQRLIIVLQIKNKRSAIFSDAT